MKTLSSFWRTFILVSIVVCSWPLFPFLTWDENIILITIPLLLCILQIILTVRFKKNHLLWLVLFNAAAFLILFNVFRASFRYITGRPTLIETCCCAGWVAPPEKKYIYVDYFDDDCGDWTGSYYYTLNINNYVTESLIELFGNTMTPHQNPIITTKKYNH